MLSEVVVPTRKYLIFGIVEKKVALFFQQCLKEGNFHYPFVHQVQHNSYIFKFQL